MADDRSKSRLFQPLTIAKGRIELRHRVIYVTMTRNRGLPLSDPASDQSPTRAWYPDELMAEDYSQRANEGGLLISEGIPPSQQGTGYPGAPGLFDPKQISGWRMVTNAVYAKRGYIYAHLWHCGRVTLPQHTGMSTVSVASYPWIMYIHGYPTAAMDMMDGHKNRYILMVTSHPSHGQNSINRLYLPMNMPSKPWIGTKSME